MTRSNNPRMLSLEGGMDSDRAMMRLKWRPDQ
jgi:hypothetical protein